MPNCSPWVLWVVVPLVLVRLHLVSPGFRRHCDDRTKLCELKSKLLVKNKICVFIKNAKSGGIFVGIRSKLLLMQYATEKIISRLVSEKMELFLENATSGGIFVRVNRFLKNVL